MLYLVATPIGNLKDITLRALEVLQSVITFCVKIHGIANTLSHYQIQKPLKSFHKFNEASREDEMIQDLDNGKQSA